MLRIQDYTASRSDSKSNPMQEGTSSMISAPGQNLREDNKVAANKLLSGRSGDFKWPYSREEI